MHGEDRQFIEKTAKNHQHGHHHGRLQVALCEEGEDVFEIGRAGQTKQIAHAVEHESGRHDPKKDILHAGFHLHPNAGAIIAHRHEEIEGKRGELQGNEDGQQLHRTDQHHQAENAEEKKQVIFRADTRADTLEVLTKDEEQGQGKADHYLEKLGILINFIHAVKQSALRLKGKQGCRKGGDAKNDGHRFCRLLGRRRVKADQEECKCSSQQHQFGKNNHKECLSWCFLNTWRSKRSGCWRGIEG